ncbi:unnamed protein product [Mycena citricolor]|uniref:C2H2-type domain-containing protein n=1 Tax=Mycena citricolor TaxID=2018698 RepID=A0AAD2HS32_9AGAR|nr:unnamed protein product [Mycena citricolor]
MVDGDLIILNLRRAPMSASPPIDPVLLASGGAPEPPSEPEVVPDITRARSISSDYSSVAAAVATEDDGDSSADSRPGSPRMTGQFQIIRENETVTCLWNNCGMLFDTLSTLIAHIHSIHIGMNKHKYTSHIRKHTGERPFMCTHPGECSRHDSAYALSHLRKECDSSFTRSDALAKHMRQQHDISPPPAGQNRPRPRKRKRGAADDEETQNETPPPGTPIPQGEPIVPTPDDIDTPPVLTRESSAPRPTTPLPRVTSLEALRTDLLAGSPGLPHPPSWMSSTVLEDDDVDITSGENLPPLLRSRYLPSVDLVLGCSPAKAMYLIMKAKHQYAMEQRALLENELQMAKSELSRLRARKDQALDGLLNGFFGASANHLIAEVPIPPSMLMAPRTPINITNNSTANMNASHMSSQAAGTHRRQIRHDSRTPQQEPPAT